MKRAALCLLLLPGLAFADAVLPTPARGDGDKDVPARCRERLDRGLVELADAVGTPHRISPTQIGRYALYAELRTPDEEFGLSVELDPSGGPHEFGWNGRAETFNRHHRVASRSGTVFTTSTDLGHQRLTQSILGAAVDDCLRMLKEGDMYDTTFTGTVGSVEIGSDPNALRVDFDARWRVRIAIDQVHGRAPFQSGEQVTFAIHSPSRFFMGDAPVGKKITLRLTGPNPQWHLEIVPSKG